MQNSSFIQNQLDEDKAVCIYKYPNKSQFTLLIGSYEQISIFKDLEDGFVIQSFDRSKAYFIKPDFKEQINPDISSFSIDKYLSHSEFQESKNDDSEFQQLVKNSIDLIKENQFQKLVPSRKKEIPLSGKLDFISLFTTISDKYSNCFCYFFLIPNESCWMGASPEVLGEFKTNEFFKTVSLAGTQKIINSENEIVWSEKEIIEQERVSEFIRQKINEFAFEKFEESRPETFYTGNLFHIKSSFNIQSKNLDPISFLNSLHPTPAVAGIPQEKAMEYLISNETYKREFYSGYIGETSRNGISRLHVNLRCMQLFANKIILYAGAGITEASDPHNEFLETENKMDSLLKYLDASTISL